MKLIKSIIAGLMIATGVMASAQTFKTDVRVWEADNSAKKITPKTIEAAFEKAGFVIAANNDMNFPFKRDFKKTHMDVYNLMVVFRKDTALALAEKYPDIGLFTPISMSIYTPKGGKSISVATLRPEVMAEMMKIPADNAEIAKLGKKIEEALKAAMPNGKFIELPYRSKKSDREVITRITMEQKGDDWEEAKDDFETAFEEKLAPNGFVMAGFTDLNYDFDEHDKEWYLFYDVYSICSIPVIYEVSKQHPEAGAFAPCSAYKYQKTDEKTIHMAFPNVYKWISSLNITDKASLDVLIDAQAKFEKMLTELKAGK